MEVPMAKLKSGFVARPFDATEVIQTQADAATYLNIALESGDPDEVADAMGVIGRALPQRANGGLKGLADNMGVSRSVMYQSFVSGGNPRLDTFLAMLDQLGISLQAVPKTSA
jgi:probable addiction module antidote protein